MFSLQRGKAAAWICLIALVFMCFGVMNPEARVYADRITALDDSQPEEPLAFSTAWNMESLEPGKLLTAEVKIANRQKHSQRILVMMALYDGQGKMEGISYVSRTIGGGSEERFIPGIRLPKKLNGHTAKVMVWEGDNLNATTMQPLTDIGINK
ncbi:hypothetical protein [Paenibacillus azoreducens]|uniref:Uncharacterized protein n=1 Tax=Paenibacillus azoreducens TaxID=116718 RepID=A0A919Y9N4_9BACL|nr:hypothetical protein [Paenibacillus azoreducens]GIO46744.1 hypothetical protein J34TS1_15090 [Paenibacillus azoreducens]